MEIPTEEDANFETFRDSVTEPIVRRLAIKPKKIVKRKTIKSRKTAGRATCSNLEDGTEEQRTSTRTKKDSENDAEELEDFIDVR